MPKKTRTFEIDGKTITVDWYRSNPAVKQPELAMFNVFVYENGKEIAQDFDCDSEQVEDLLRLYRQRVESGGTSGNRYRVEYQMGPNRRYVMTADLLERNSQGDRYFSGRPDFGTVIIPKRVDMEIISMTEVDPTTRVQAPKRIK